MPTVDRILIVPCVGGGLTPQCLPSTYNKDLQESVELILDYIKTIGDSIQIVTGVRLTLAANSEKLRAALDGFMLATDLADYLVRKKCVLE